MSFLAEGVQLLGNWLFPEQKPPPPPQLTAGQVKGQLLEERLNENAKFAKACAGEVGRCPKGYQEINVHAPSKMVNGRYYVNRNGPRKRFCHKWDPYNICSMSHVFGEGWGTPEESGRYLRLLKDPLTGRTRACPVGVYCRDMKLPWCNEERGAHAFDGLPEGTTQCKVGKRNSGSVGLARESRENCSGENCSLCNLVIRPSKSDDLSCAATPDQHSCRRRGGCSWHGTTCRARPTRIIGPRVGPAYAPNCEDLDPERLKSGRESACRCMALFAPKCEEESASKTACVDPLLDKFTENTSCARVLHGVEENDAECRKWWATLRLGNANDAEVKNAFIANYCNKHPKNFDCRCHFRGRDADFQRLRESNKVIPVACWWGACKDNAQFMVPARDDMSCDANILNCVNNIQIESKQYIDLTNMDINQAPIECKQIIQSAKESATGSTTGTTATL